MTSRIRKWVLSSPPGEWAINQMRELLIGATKQGPVPQHIAFVMDGNRRWAREHRLETVEGHNLGYEALAKILEVSYKSGVRVVTVYAFSIENFKRSRYEVDALMELAKTKLTQLAQHGELLDRYGAKVRVIGQRDLLKPDVIAAIERAERMTAGNDQCILNICFPYTSREEISTGIKKTVEEFSRPITQTSTERDRRSALQEERIANIIRSQHLSDHANSHQDHSQDKLSSGYNSHLSTSSSTTSLSLPSTTDLDLLGTENEQETLSSSMSSSTTLQTLHSTDVTPQSPPARPSLMSNPKTTTTALSQKSSLQPNLIYPSPESITSTTLNKNMYTSTDPPLDLLIRTSGVARLSDFMLWQCHENTQIVFLDILWPEFDLWSFLPVLWEWQWRARKEINASQNKDSIGGEDAFVDSKLTGDKPKPHPWKADVKVI